MPRHEKDYSMGFIPAELIRRAILRKFISAKAHEIWTAGRVLARELLYIQVEILAFKSKWTLQTTTAH